MKSAPKKIFWILLLSFYIVYLLSLLQYIIWFGQSDSLQILHPVSVLKGDVTSSQICRFTKGNSVDAFQVCRLYENTIFHQTNHPTIFWHFSNGSSASFCHRQQQRCLRTTPAWSCLNVLLNAQHSLRNEPVLCRVAPEWGISVVIGLKMKQKHGDLSWWAHPGRDEPRWLPCLLEPSSRVITQTPQDRCFENYRV